MNTLNFNPAKSSLIAGSSPVRHNAIKVKVTTVNICIAFGSHVSSTG